MRITIALPLLMVAAVLGTGCGNKKKDEDTAATATAATTATPPPAQTATAPAASGTADAPAASGTPAAGSDDVASYPDEVPLGQTVEVLKEFTVHQAADNASAVLTQLAKGTLINLKASHSNWIKVEYPSGPSELSPGWIELKSNDPRVKQRKDNPLSKYKTKPHRPTPHRR